MSHEDAILVQRSLDDDPAAFVALIERYAGPMAAVAWLVVRHGEDARDVVQQSFFEAWRGLSTLRDPARFGAWLRGIVVNTGRRVVEKRRRTRQGTPPVAGRGGPDDPEEATMRNERRRSVSEALDRLDEAHREVVVLHYVQGLRVREVADLLDRPEGSVKRMLSEARLRLKRELVEMARDEFDEVRLTDEQRKRLERIPTFPRREPVIRVAPLDDRAPEVRARAPSAVFPGLRPGAEACFATYDHPGGRLTSLSHVRVEGPVDVDGSPALRCDQVDFGPDGAVEWVWAPHYRVVGDRAIYCAKSFGKPHAPRRPLRPGDAEWGEPAPREESLRLVPGACHEPSESGRGCLVDPNPWAVRIGRRTHRCIRRPTAAATRRGAWAEAEVTDWALEEFLDEAGRLLLFRRYNGTAWTAVDPRRKGHEAGWIETLAAAGTPQIEVFGHAYRLWYDQIAEAALTG
ncbi:MAG: RNA polymerase sigma factor [Planctomycetota bacterium]